MPPYRAGPGGGAFGSNVYPDSRPRIDVAPILDAALGGASSLIQNAYYRKRADAELALRDQQLTMERERLTQQQQSAKAEQDYRDRDLAERAENNRRRSITEGFTPAHTEFDTTPDTTDFSREFQPPPANVGLNGQPTPMTTQSALQRAMMASVPTPQVGTQAPPAAPPQAPPNRLKTVPESYDPMKSATVTRESYILGLRDADAAARQQAGFANQSAMEDARQKNRLALRDKIDAAARGLASFKSKLPKQPGSRSSGEMTANQKRNYAVALAAGTLQHFNGSMDEALKAYDDEDTSGPLHAAGVTRNDFTVGSMKVKPDKTGSDILGLLRSGQFSLDDPEAVDKAVGIVQNVHNTVETVRGNKPPPGPINQPGGSTPKPGAASTTPYTDSEVKAAMDAGNTTEDAVHAWIKKQRAKKPSGGE